MNRFTLVLAGLRFYRRTHFAILCGCALSAMVLIGALFVGDSVKGTLERIALSRLGRIHHALDSGQRYFRDPLARRVRDGLRTDVVEALHVQGMAVRDNPGADGKKQINRVEVLGVDAQFLGMAEAPSPVKLAAGQVALNEKLAAAIGAKVGQEIALRLFKPGLLSREAPLASQSEKDTQRSLLSVAAVLTEAELGRFSLRSDQTGPYLAFVDLAWLQETLNLKERANLLLAGLTRADPREWLHSAWSLDDLGLAIRSPEGTGIVQLQTERIYLDPSVSGPARDLRPDHAAVLYYLVDSLSAGGGKSTPYSFVAAVSPSSDRKLSPIPPGMKDDEILVNRWLADQLSVKEGDRLELAYSELTSGNAFQKKSREFRVRGVLEMDALAAERDLVPEFPGLTDVETCKDWKIFIPTEEEKLKDAANEAYWNKFRQTPKAFVTLAAGSGMWANRHGDLMAIRYLASGTNETELRGQLREKIDPEQTGLVFRPVRDQALKAVHEAMDLGQLFLGLSIFLIAASLLLTAMAFVFTVEQRAKEMGILLATGYTPGQVRWLFLAEGAVLAVLGSALGIWIGRDFARFLIWGLSFAWSGAVADASIEFHTRASSAAIGAVSSAVISLLAMAFTLRRQARRPVRELVVEDYSLALEREASGGGSGRLRKVVGLAGLALAAAILIHAIVTHPPNPAGSFFAAGALLLVAGLAAIRMWLAALSRAAASKLSIVSLGIRNAARRPGRSLTTAGMLASGCFMVFSVSAMKEDLASQASERRSGTGGFRLYAESTVPIPHDLNGERARKEYRLSDPEALNGVSVVPLRVHEGDDASCLNLNQSLTPPLLGVEASRLGKLGAFAGPELWDLLDRERSDGAVPALIGDSATAMWKLKKSVGPEDGAVLDYQDERGKPFKVKLVGALPSRLSVLQGRLLISNANFTKLYPSEGGTKVFLIDTPAGREGAVARYLSDKLETAGFDAVSSIERLQEFYVVESAYLRMFLVLGGLGLILGTFGVLFLVVRQAFERRNELALLRAVGYRRGEAAKVVLAEHFFVVIAGLAVGASASLLAIGPSAWRPGNSVPYDLLSIFLLGTAAMAAGSIALAAWVVLRSPLVPALRQE